MYFHFLFYVISVEYHRPLVLKPNIEYRNLKIQFGKCYVALWFSLKIWSILYFDGFFKFQGVFCILLYHDQSGIVGLVHMLPLTFGLLALLWLSFSCYLSCHIFLIFNFFFWFDSTEISMKNSICWSFNVFLKVFKFPDFKLLLETWVMHFIVHT